jgi:hypothetical protein
VLGCGGCGGLVVLGIVAALVIPALSRRAGGPTAGDTASVAAADREGTTLFTSSPDGLNEDLSSHYLPFSFRYPEGWRVMEQGDQPDQKNFVKVEKGENGFTAENFAVGYMFATPGHESDPELIRQLLGQFQEQFAAQFPNFQRVGDDRLTISGRQATGFKFTSRVRAEGGDSVDVYGRVLVLPVGDGKGLSIVMLGTPVGSGLRGIDDLGVKGGIPVILRTFRLGRSDAAASGEDASAPADSQAESGGKPSEKPGEGKPSGQDADAPPPQDENQVDDSHTMQPLNPRRP